MSETKNTNCLIQKFEPGLCFPMGAGGTWWRVLEVDPSNSRALVMADHSICQKSYHEVQENVTWEDCTLRAWLNGEYFENTFSAEEQEAISYVCLPNPDSRMYGTNGGRDTTDRIWLLSREEVEKLLKDKPYCGNGSWWWLRSPGYYAGTAVYVHSDGTMGDSGNYVENLFWVRPVFLLDMTSPFFESLKGDSKDLAIKIPNYYVRKKKLLSIRSDLTDIRIPRGVTQIAEHVFDGMENLRSVTFPPSLRKVGKEAFRGCCHLRNIYGANGSISYGTNVFQHCSELIYTPEMFRNAGKLCASFADHLECCGPEEYAWIFMYQKGRVWESRLAGRIDERNAAEILTVMTEHIAEVKKTPKKQAAGAVRFVQGNRGLLSEEGISQLMDALKSRELTEAVQALQEDLP